MSEARLIDCRHLGRPHVIGCWQVGETLVDPGPESCLETLLAGLASEPRRVLLTHIHLDHAGAAGALAQRFPEIEVCVHRRGAPHLVDPSRLLASAARLYGDAMDRLWGRVLPVPERNLRVLDGGERLEGGVEVAYTPGHASHHVSYLIGGTAYVGDVAGVRIPPSDYVLMPTPPPDIDPPLWSRSIDTVRSWGPERLALTHFGAVDEPEPHLELAARTLALWSGRAREGRDSFLAGLRSELEARAAANAPAYEQAAPARQLYLGLERYWQTREGSG